MVGGGLVPHLNPAMNGPTRDQASPSRTSHEAPLLPNSGARAQQLVYRGEEGELTLRGCVEVGLFERPVPEVGLGIAAHEDGTHLRFAVVVDVECEAIVGTGRGGKRRKQPP